MKVAASHLETLVTAIFCAAGSNDDEAACISDHLVRANLVGHDSHGVIRVHEYLQWLRDDKICPNQKMELVWQNDALAITQGNLGYGQVVGKEAVELGIEKSGRAAVAVIAIRQCSHLGRLGHWAEMAAVAGRISLHFASTNGSGVLVAPFGGTQRRLSANPLAVGVPRRDQEPIVLDIATAATAEGKLKVARNRGRKISPGCLVDASGKPTDDPEVFYADPPGAILPFGGHKGYGLSLLVELLAGALTGNGCSHHGVPQLEQGMLSLYLDPQQMDQDNLFFEEVNTFIEFVRSSHRSTPDTPILVPGEMESQICAQRLNEGIELDDITWQQLAGEAHQLEVSQELIDAVRESHSK